MTETNNNEVEMPEFETVQEETPEQVSQEIIEEIVDELNKETSNTTVEYYDSDDESQEFLIARELNLLKENINNINFEHKEYIGYMIGILITSHVTYLGVLKLLYILTVFVTSVGISTAIVAYSINPTYNKIETQDDEEEYENTEEYKYLEFLNQYYDELKEVLDEEEYKETNDYKLEQLSKNKINHFETIMPFQQKNKMIFFYNKQDEAFHYYTKSDVMGKVLNAVCREYVVKNKCVNLFQDEEEIIFLREEYGRNIDEINETEESNKIKEEDKNEQEDDNKEEENKGVFYKKQKKDNEKNKIELTTNKYIYKGNLEEYELNFREVASSKNANIENYFEYKKLFDKIN